MYKSMASVSSGCSSIVAANGIDTKTFGFTAYLGVENQTTFG